MWIMRITALNTHDFGCALCFYLPLMLVHVGVKLSLRSFLDPVMRFSNTTCITHTQVSFAATQAVLCAVIGLQLIAIS